MIRGLVVIIILISVVGLIIYFTLPGGNSYELTPESRFFSRSSKIISPPEYASSIDPERKITRFLDRLKWGTNQSVNWTIEALKKKKIEHLLRKLSDG